ncbi:MAG: CoA ester lyase, partial [Candidatus Thiodiazotropha sp.]
CSVSIRINGLDTHFCYRDIIEIAEAAGDKLDTILVPKVNQPSDLQFVALMLEQIESAVGIPQINLHALIETAMGMANVEAIAQTCPERLEALVFGVADYAASTQARTTSMGGVNPDYLVLDDADAQGKRQVYLGNQWHFAMSRMIVACRAYGLRPIDGPFGDFSDPEGFLAVARSFAALGGEGKWAIHPSQIELANQVFTPGEAEVTRARRIIDAMKEATAKGLGAVSLDGRMIDAASIRQAQVVIEKMAQIEQLDGREAVA